MHLQQTKKGSIETGGPQYYFHDLTDPVKTYLRAKGAVRVALVTPYGATKTDYFAVSTDKKLNAQQKPVPGNSAHFGNFNSRRSKRKSAASWPSR